MNKEKITTAIERIRAFEPRNGYYLAFSGGKDSVAVKALMDMAGVKYDAVYRVTSVDPPELVSFIRDYHPDVTREIPLDKDGNGVSMWTLIPQEKCPPTRIMRYCCKVLKEGGGFGRFIVTGVRWAESGNRKRSHGIVNVMSKDKNNELAQAGFENNNRSAMILLNDNDSARRMTEHCFAKHKTMLNPIIEWTDQDVWEFIRGNKIPYCKLYDCGYHRLGCIGCPMAGKKQRKADLNKYPKYKNAYLSAFSRMLEARKANNLETPWNSAEEVLKWWLEDESVEGQLMLDGFDEDI